MIEAQLRYIVSALTQARREKLKVLSVQSQPHARFNQRLQASLRGSVFHRGGCTSYFLDRNGRNSTNWPWTTFYLRRRLAHADLRDYDAAG
jgi:hypothetical protein